MRLVQKIFNKGKILTKIIHLLILLAFALTIDLFLFALTSSCANCANFFQFLSSPFSLTGPMIVSLSVFFPKLTGVFKKKYTEKE